MRAPCIASSGVSFEAPLRVAAVDRLLRANFGRLVLLRDHPFAPEPTVEPLAERDDLLWFHHASALRVLDALHVLFERILCSALRIAVLGCGSRNAHLLPIRFAYDLTITPSVILASEHRHSQAFRVDAALHGSSHATSAGLGDPVRMVGSAGSERDAIERTAALIRRLRKGEVPPPYSLETSLPEL